MERVYLIKGSRNSVFLPFKFQGTFKHTIFVRDNTGIAIQENSAHRYSLIKVNNTCENLEWTKSNEYSD